MLITQWIVVDSKTFTADSWKSAYSLKAKAVNMRTAVKLVLQLQITQITKKITHGYYRIERNLKWK